MKYGYFDNDKKEYVIDRVDLPTSWTNYLGVKNTCVVINQTAGGYAFYKTPEYHRITRFRANSIPMDRPGHYVYIRDNDLKDYWSISWQPVGKDLNKAKYTCRHGLSYTKYECDYSNIEATQTLVVPINDDVELWDVTLKNNGNKARNLTLFSYCEFSFHHIMIDNQNFQMSLYCAGSSYENGIIEHDLFYEEFGYQYFTGNFEPDGYDCLRDEFLGSYRTEDNPIAVEKGKCSGSSELGNNHCGSLQKNIILKPGEIIRCVYMLGEGNRDQGERIRKKYSDVKNVDNVYKELQNYWEGKCKKMHIMTPNEGLNTMINIWTLYQAEINVMFSRFASFIEVGGRTGLGYRDTAQDAMTVIHSNPEKCKERLEQLLQGLVSEGYGLHLFQPEWFEKKKEKKEFNSPTIIPKKRKEDIIHGIDDACSDDALWLVGSIVEYVKETGDFGFLDKEIDYADDKKGSVYEHMERILDFSTREVGSHNICKGLRADWNDCLNLGGGESAMVSFLHVWALGHFISLAKYLQRNIDVEKFEAIYKNTINICNDILWDKEWYIRGITKSGNKIGKREDEEGKIHLESNVWAVISKAAPKEKAIKAMNSINKYLYTDYGIMLNAPSYTKPDDDIGFVTRVYPGLKENGSIFSHPNPWAWVAECMLGRGNRAMKFYNAICPYYQNEKIEIRKAEPYSYCQFIVGRDHKAYGKANHPFMTGTAGWAYFSATHYILGISPEYDYLKIDPCIPKEWENFDVIREFRNVKYNIHIENPKHISKGIEKIFVNGKEVERIYIQNKVVECNVRVIMG